MNNRSKNEIKAIEKVCQRIGVDLDRDVILVENADWLRNEI